MVEIFLDLNIKTNSFKDWSSYIVEAYHVNHTLNGYSYRALYIQYL